MRSIPATLDPDIVARIDDRIRRLESDEGVTVVWAIESGSRAWGFPSPDSDYDCRFLYLRPRDDYLSLWPHRDVIETPLDKIYDVNGWDVAKALKLLIKGNATPVEWLRSPIIYSGEEHARDALLRIADEVVNRDDAIRHYLHVGQLHAPLTGTVRLKRVFYALRPALALRWLALHPESALPPMDLPTLMAQTDPPGDVAELIHELVERKARTRELGEGEVSVPVLALIEEEFRRAGASAPSGKSLPVHEQRPVVDRYFRSLIGP
jgi:predicted nucleotidyltransferase